eukprot:5130509-Pleurochrysis_carterae.AAC.1
MYGLCVSLCFAWSALDCIVERAPHLDIRTRLAPDAVAGRSCSQQTRCPILITPCDACKHAALSSRKHFDGLRTGDALIQRWRSDRNACREVICSFPSTLW